MPTIPTINGMLMENKEILIEKIKELKNKLNGRVVIPAHHYQRNEIVGL